MHYIFLFILIDVGLYWMYFSRYIISSESGNILIWNRITGQVIFKEEQPGVRQLIFLEEGLRFLAISKPPVPVGQDAPLKTSATGIARNIPSKSYSFNSKKMK